jgi:hypothetical protein
MTIGKRIVLGFTLAVAISAAQGFYGYSRLASLSEDAHIVVTDCLPGTYLAGQIEALVQENRGLLLTHLLAKDEAERRDVERRITERKQEIDGIATQYEGTITKEEDRKLFEALTTVRGDWLKAKDEVVRLNNAGKPAEAKLAYETLAYPAYRKVKAAGDAMGMRSVRSIRRTAKRPGKRSRRAYGRGRPA